MEKEDCSVSFLSSDCNSFFSTAMSCSTLSLPQRPNTSISSNLGMASLLNDLADELDAADNNTTEPDDPTSADVDTDDSLVYVLTEGKDNI